MGVFMASSRLLSPSKWPMMGVRGSSDGSGEKGLLEGPTTKPWPLVMSGVGLAGILESVMWIWVRGWVGLGWVGCL